MKKILLISILMAGCASAPKGHETSGVVNDIDKAHGNIHSARQIAQEIKTEVNADYIVMRSKHL